MKKIKALLFALASTLCLGCFTACGDFTALLTPDVSLSSESGSETPNESETGSIEETGSEEKSEEGSSEEGSSEEESSEEGSSEEGSSEEGSSEEGSSEEGSSEEGSSEENSSEEEEEEEEEGVLGEGYETITIAEALELCGEAGNITEERYYILATIDTIINAQYGNMRISDETGSIEVYGTYSEDGSLTFLEIEERPAKGDKVLLHCILQNYDGTKEVKNARLIDFEKAVIDDSDYVEMTIADARTAAVDSLVKVTGVVSQITYANGMVPNGVMLIDETGSIYVFDNDLAGGVVEGNTVTILATKAYWILDKEQSAAEKFGYKGCNQLTDATLVSNDGEVSAFSTQAIEETTIKAIMETPVTDDITTIVYKVNALVKKAPDSGFTNYIFNDIDGETGSYTYTQCNGNDFGWLDEFDGKICTVYLTVLNAKSADSGCIYRFLPIDVKDEGYVFDTANAAKFAVEYYGVDQFSTLYTADPALELNTTVSSEILNIENATLSYTSSNTEVVYFEKVEETIVMHCGKTGTATITVKGAYNGNEYEESVQVTVEQAVTYDYLTVAEAIATAPGTENVIVKGIVGPSVANQVAFYLFGEDGSVITVRTTADVFVGLEIGHEVIMQGTRKTITKGGADYFGQTAIDDAILLENYYGKHEYSTEKFVESTAAEFYALNATVDYSTTVFVFTAKINYVDNGRYTTLELTSGSTTVSLYMSGAGDYAWLKDYYGQEVLLEVAACNWNSKKYWRGCILAIRNEDGTKVYNTANFDAN